jgi:hypothetical protein
VPTNSEGLYKKNRQIGDYIFELVGTLSFAHPTVVQFKFNMISWGYLKDKPRHVGVLGRIVSTP